MVSRRLDKLSAGLALSNKFLPVHCIVARDECPSRVLQDGFVIVPAQTKFHEIVSVVLRTMEADVGKIEQDERADGQILIKNWNPLTIGTVSENRSVTVQEILGDLMNVAVLKIQISKMNSDEKRSTRLLKSMMPLITDEREKLVLNRFYSTMPDDTEDDEDVQHQSSLSKPTTSPNGYSYTSSNSNTTDGDNTPLNLSTKPYSSVSTIPLNNSKTFLNYPFASLLSLATHSSALAPSLESSSMHSAASSPMKDYSYNRRQRERTTFDPHEETPRLLQIFTDTKHPTRYQIASICENLNALPCRKGKKALEPYNIQYWFKNARAALKRKKRRFASSDGTNLNPSQILSDDVPSPSPRPIRDDEQIGHPSIKCELDSSDEIDGDDVEEDEPMEFDDKQKQPINHPNYYFNCLRAFDISLTDQQQRVKNGQSEESNDDDNISSVSEQSPPTQISFHSNVAAPISTGPLTKTTNTFDYNRSRRNRIFIDPTSEVPKLEQWFAIETHPDHILIERICSELNEGEYRRKFPKLESKHIRLWFKNHRAKVKRICRIQTPHNSSETFIDPMTHSNSNINNSIEKKTD